jgi:hypothetical protein
VKTLNALCVCLQYKHPRSMKRVIRSDKPVTLLPLFWSHKCDFGTEPRSRINATSAVKGLKVHKNLYTQSHIKIPVSVVCTHLDTIFIRFFFSYKNNHKEK